MWRSRGLYSSVLHPQKKKKNTEILWKKDKWKKFSDNHWKFFLSQQGTPWGSESLCPSATNTQGGLAGLCSSPRHQNKPFMGCFLGKGFIFPSKRERWEAQPQPPRPGAQVGSVCTRHCGTRDRCRQQRGAKEGKGERGEKLKILQEQTILPRAAVNKITAAGWFAAM